MPAVTLNGVSFAGLVTDLESVVRAPAKATHVRHKIEVVKVAASGTRTAMVFGSKTDYQLEWPQVPEATRAAVQAIFDLTTTFSATVLGTTLTVQCEDGDYTEEQVLDLPGPLYYFTVKLTLRQP